MYFNKKESEKIRRLAIELKKLLRKHYHVFWTKRGAADYSSGVKLHENTWEALASLYEELIAWVE
jgi:hypothetical protein